MGFPERVGRSLWCICTSSSASLWYQCLLQLSDLHATMKFHGALKPQCDSSYTCMLSNPRFSTILIT